MPNHGPSARSIFGSTFLSGPVAGAPPAGDPPEPTVQLSIVVPNVIGKGDCRVEGRCEPLYAYWLRSFNEPNDIAITSLRTFDGRDLVDVPIDAGHLAEQRVFFPIGEIRLGRMPQIHFEQIGFHTAPSILNLVMFCTRLPMHPSQFERAAALAPAPRGPARDDLVSLVVKCAGKVFLDILRAKDAERRADAQTIQARASLDFPAVAAPALPPEPTPPAPAGPTEALERFAGAGDHVPTLVRVRDPEGAADLRRVFADLGDGFPSAERVTAALGAPTELRQPGCSEPVRAWIFMSPQSICSLQLTVDRRWEVHGAPFPHARPSPLPSDVLVAAHSCVMLTRVFMAVQNAESADIVWSGDLGPLEPTTSRHSETSKSGWWSDGWKAQMEGMRAMQEAFAEQRRMLDALGPLSPHAQLPSTQLPALAPAPKSTDLTRHPVTGQQGTWICTACEHGMVLGGTDHGAWRWNGETFEHKCAGVHPQAGHFRCRFVPVHGEDEAGG